MPSVQLLLALDQPCSLRRAFGWLLSSLECADATRAMHAAHVRYLLGHFDDLDVREIRYPQIYAYVLAERARGLAKETIKKRLSTLKQALLEAVRHDVIERLPQWPVVRSDTRPTTGFWTLDQWRAVHELCDDPELRVWLTNGWWGGLHMSDLDRFRWGDVDLAARTWIRRNTKTKVEPAKLPLTDEWHRVLSEWRRQVAGHPRDLVAGHVVGNCNPELKEICLRAGVPRISTIGLRHSCATYLYESGCTPGFIQHWMGLTSERMLQRHYRHATAKTVAAGLAKLEERARAEAA